MTRSLLSFSLVAAGLLAGCARPLPPAERVQMTNVSALREAFGGSVTGDATAATAAPAAEPTGWATLRGTFKFSGSPPERQALEVNKDQSVCAPGGKTVLGESLVVDSATQGIRDVVIYLTGPAKFPVGDPKWEHPSYAEARDATIDFDQKNCVFLTHVLAMRTTQKLRILNSDPVGHNTKIDATGRAQQINATIPAADSLMYQPGGESPETFPVSCTIHPWMSARMIVRNSPYFAVTKPDGTFEIANVPAGVPLEFRVWQERARFVEAATVNGNAEKWPKGRLKMTLQPDQPKEMEVVLDAGILK
jgi:hypothetical protein